MQSIQLCGPVLPPPKLRLNTERSTPLPTEARRAALRAAETIRRVDAVIAANAPCHYCQSGLYEEIPDPRGPKPLQHNRIKHPVTVESCCRTTDPAEPAVAPNPQVSGLVSFFKHLGDWPRHGRLVYLRLFPRPIPEV